MLNYVPYQTMSKFMFHGLDYVILNSTFYSLNVFVSYLYLLYVFVKRSRIF